LHYKKNASPAIVAPAPVSFLYYSVPSIKSTPERCFLSNMKNPMSTYNIYMVEDDPWYKEYVQNAQRKRNHPVNPICYYENSPTQIIRR
jgi:hypothetical protein